MMSKGPTSLERDGFGRTVWCHTLEHGQDWRDALRPEFWYGVVSRLRPGDRIECHSADHHVQFNVFCFSSNERSDTVRFDIGFSAIYPHDLPLPSPIIRPERYEPRNNGAQWTIVEVATGEVLVEFPRRQECLEGIAALERRDAKSENSPAPKKSPRPNGRQPETRA